MWESIQTSPLYRAGEEKYLALAEREQRALRWLCAFLLIVFIVFALLLPARTFFNTAVDEYKAAREDYSWMDANSEAVPEAGQESGLQAGQSLFGIANATSKGFQISFKRYEPLGENALSLWIEQVSFNRLMLWLERLDKRYRVTVKEISVEEQPGEGLVNARLIIQG